MKIILTSNIKKLGKIGDQVTVKDGFARNYLFPQKKALRNNKRNLEYFEKLKEEIEKKEQIEKKKAEENLAKLDNIKIQFDKESDEKDQLYGSVTIKEIYNFLINKDINIKIDDIGVKEPIKTVGEHLITINPYDNLSKEVKIYINKIQK
ncbi:MAG: 50S ribosomal protein L9 [Alphaproteobacteria bacterium MarineAlpha5_Bin9]|nr:MAG: 50S ribosomal protein L9 [Alphaproteobacteria bacterium MarineAlpha5_Bin9]|tara:strand:- start:47808 stop:48257 length:450 start_codon:yes stop_codon:yes gene_type:complete